MGKIANLLNIVFDSEPVYGDGDKYIKTKVKKYGDRVNTNFQGKKVPKKKNASDKCLSLIMLDCYESNKSIIHKYFWKSVNMK